MTEQAKQAVELLQILGPFTLAAVFLVAFLDSRKSLKELQEKYDELLRALLKRAGIE